MSLALPVLSGLLGFVIVVGFLLMQPHPDITTSVWVILVSQSVQGFMVTYGWTILGLAAALLAAALTAVSIVGYLSKPNLLAIKMQSIRDVIEVLVYAGTGLATVTASAYIFGIPSLIVLQGPIDDLDPIGPADSEAAAIAPSSTMSEAIVPQLQDTIAAMTLGITGFLLVVCARYLMRTISIWFANDADIHANERALLVARLAVARARNAKLLGELAGTTQTRTTASTYLILGPACIAASTALAAAVGSSVGSGNAGTFASFGAALSAYLVYIVMTIALQLMISCRRGPNIQRINGVPAAAVGRWRLECVAWTLGLVIALAPGVAIVWAFASATSVGPAEALRPLIAATLPVIASLFVRRNHLSWQAVAAHAARKELMGYVQTDSRRLSQLTAMGRATAAPTRWSAFTDLFRLSR